MNISITDDTVLSVDNSSVYLKTILILSGMRESVADPVADRIETIAGRLAFRRSLTSSGGARLCL
ncbi:MAG: hypothetical protein VXU50_05485, partial [Verrucomicrobiota bacterium]|nr:hypothetical protein [Verrucomicrobiota bacterium]